ncbi:hypothetical protein L1987_48783 [Smallanthus sonchifolius]|uniref:Uncharacterized protein n=1 Tax=Smallanthus sonchifolius TaxID=185202 RepID=A0ACB9FTZ7_9ASTR|nr:hypothetical protein L1987_48783 [Smallanthus sonchifolius]
MYRIQEKLLHKVSNGEKLSSNRRGGTARSFGDKCFLRRSDQVERKSSSFFSSLRKAIVNIRAAEMARPYVTAGTSNLTEGDQRFYSSTEVPFAARSKGCQFSSGVFTVGIENLDFSEPSFFQNLLRSSFFLRGLPASGFNAIHRNSTNPLVDKSDDSAAVRNFLSRLLDRVDHVGIFTMNDPSGEASHGTALINNLFGHTVPPKDQVDETCDGKPSRTVQRALN